MSAITATAIAVISTGFRDPGLAMAGVSNVPDEEEAADAARTREVSRERLMRFKSPRSSAAVW